MSDKVSKFKLEICYWTLICKRTGLLPKDLIFMINDYININNNDCHHRTRLICENAVHWIPHEKTKKYRFLKAVMKTGF